MNKINYELNHFMKKLPVNYSIQTTIIYKFLCFLIFFFLIFFLLWKFIFNYYCYSNCLFFWPTANEVQQPMRCNSQWQIHLLFKSETWRLMIDSWLLRPSTSAGFPIHLFCTTSKRTISTSLSSSLNHSIHAKKNDFF